MDKRRSLRWALNTALRARRWMSLCPLTCPGDLLLAQPSFSQPPAANGRVLCTCQGAACDRGGDLRDVSVGDGPAVADPGADGWEEAALPVQPVSGVSSGSLKSHDLVSSSRPFATFGFLLQNFVLQKVKRGFSLFLFHPEFRQ